MSSSKLAGFLHCSESHGDLEEAAKAAAIEAKEHTLGDEKSGHGLANIFKSHVSILGNWEFRERAFLTI